MAWSTVTFLSVQMGQLHVNRVYYVRFFPIIREIKTPEVGLYDWFSVGLFTFLCYTRI